MIRISAQVAQIDWVWPIYMQIRLHRSPMLEIWLECTKAPSTYLCCYSFYGQYTFSGEGAIEEKEH